MNIWCRLLSKSLAKYLSENFKLEMLNKIFQRTFYWSNFKSLGIIQFKLFCVVLIRKTAGLCSVIDVYDYKFITNVHLQAIFGPYVELSGNPCCTAC